MDGNVSCLTREVLEVLEPGLVGIMEELRMAGHEGALNSPCVHTSCHFYKLP
jgi:hypothetical protein